MKKADDILAELERCERRIDRALDTLLQAVDRSAQPRRGPRPDHRRTSQRKEARMMTGKELERLLNENEVATPRRRRPSENVQTPGDGSAGIPRRVKTPADLTPWTGWKEGSKTGPSQTPAHHDASRPELGDEQPHVSGETSVASFNLKIVANGMALEFGHLGLVEADITPMLEREIGAGATLQEAATAVRREIISRYR